MAKLTNEMFNPAVIAYYEGPNRTPVVRIYNHVISEEMGDEVHIRGKRKNVEGRPTDKRSAEMNTILHLSRTVSDIQQELDETKGHSGPNSQTQEDPICVIATSVHEGKIFADNLGLANYEVYTNMMQRGMQGKRFREMVISTEYLNNLFDALHNSTGAFTTARLAMQRRGSGNINY